MRVQIQYTAQIRAAAGREEEEVDIPEGSTVAQLLEHLAAETCRVAAGHLLSSDGGLQPTLLIAVNDQAVSTGEARSVVLRTGDVVTLLPPIAGG